MATVVTNRDQEVNADWSLLVRLSENGAGTDTCAVALPFDQLMRAFACSLYLERDKSWRAVERAFDVSHKVFSEWRKGLPGVYSNLDWLDALLRDDRRKKTSELLGELAVLADSLEKGTWISPVGEDQMRPKMDETPVLAIEADSASLAKQPSAKKRSASRGKRAKASTRESDGQSPQLEPERPAKSPR
jgi:hypothetical protein